MTACLQTALLVPLSFFSAGPAKPSSETDSPSPSASFEPLLTGWGFCFWVLFSFFPKDILSGLGWEEGVLSLEQATLYLCEESLVPGRNPVAVAWIRDAVHQLAAHQLHPHDGGNSAYRQSCLWVEAQRLCCCLLGIVR